MKVLVINSGSSSIKYGLFEMRKRSVLATGVLECIGEPHSRLIHRSPDEVDGNSQRVREGQIRDHRQGMEVIAEILKASNALPDPGELRGVGHRVVHGGEAFREPTLIDESVIEGIRKKIALAPLHNPANIVGIELARDQYPQVPQVAVFDTAFHQTMPPYAYHYAIPYKLYEEYRIRRYGFHGTSHRYVAKQAARYLGRPLESLNLISLHLGNGASAAAIEGGKSIDTSMGMTPLEGLVMGTRCGDIDPAIVLFLSQSMGESTPALDSILNKESGLKGVCGVNDMREVLRLSKDGNQRAQLAVEMYAYRTKKYVGAYSAVLGRVDAIVFTAGIGENKPEIRARSLRGLSGLGIEVDPERNAGNSNAIREINKEGAPVRILVIPTNEEFEIAEQTVSTIQRHLSPGETDRPRHGR